MENNDKDQFYDTYFSLLSDHPNGPENIIYYVKYLIDIRSLLANKPCFFGQSSHPINTLQGFVFVH